MSSNAKAFDAVYESLLSSDEERLSAQDEQDLKVEAGQAPAPAPEAPAEEAPAATEEQAPEAVPAEAAPVEAAPTEQVTEQPKKKLSPAQERITELVHERNEYQKKARELEEKWARMDERTRIIREREEAEARRVAEEQARFHAETEAARRIAERPDPTMDPVGARLWDVEEDKRKIQAELNALRDQATQYMQQQQAQQEVNQFTATLTQDIQARRQAQPDYDDAAKYATETRKQFWMSLGHPEQVANQRVQQEALAVAAEAIQNGRSPSAVYYDLAKQWGYQPNGGQVTKQTGGMVTPAQKLAQAAAGQKVTGLGGGPNVASEDTFDIDGMTPAQFAELPEERFLNMIGNPTEYKRLQKWLEKHELGIDR